MQQYKAKAKTSSCEPDILESTASACNCSRWLGHNPLHAERRDSIERGLGETAALLSARHHESSICFAERCMSMVAVCCQKLTAIPSVLQRRRRPTACGRRSTCQCNRLRWSWMGQTIHRWAEIPTQMLSVVLSQAHISSELPHFLLKPMFCCACCDWKFCDPSFVFLVQILRAGLEEMISSVQMFPSTLRLDLFVTAFGLLAPEGQLIRTGGHMHTSRSASALSGILSPCSSPTPVTF